MGFLIKYYNGSECVSRSGVDCEQCNIYDVEGKWVDNDARDRFQGEIRGTITRIDDNLVDFEADDKGIINAEGAVDRCSGLPLTKNLNVINVWDYTEDNVYRQECQGCKKKRPKKILPDATALSCTRIAISCCDMSWVDNCAGGSYSPIYCGKFKSGGMIPYNLKSDQDCINPEGRYECGIRYAGCTYISYQGKYMFSDGQTLQVGGYCGNGWCGGLAWTNSYLLDSCHGYSYKYLNWENVGQFLHFVGRPGSLQWLWDV